MSSTALKLSNDAAARITAGGSDSALIIAINAAPVFGDAYHDSPLMEALDGVIKDTKRPTEVRLAAYNKLGDCVGADQVPHNAQAMEAIVEYCNAAQEVA